MRRTTGSVRSLPAASVHAWRLQRQLLQPAHALSDPVDVARRLVGVQAQVVSAAALAIGLRSQPATRDATNASAATAVALRERRLVRSWAMRSTLHLFAADDVPTIAAALGGKERWRRPAWLRWFGVTEIEMDRLIDAIGDVLDDGRPRTRAELADEISVRLGAKQGRLLLGSWGNALKVASDRHYLVQSAEEEAGTRFVRASRWLTSWRDEDEGVALAALVERYLAAYGPATLQEILRWWGVSVVAVMKPIIAELGDRLTLVEVDGTRAYLRSEDLDDILSTRPPSGDVRLVGAFDPFIVGAGLRGQLLPPANLKRISRTAGWISPVVLIDGVAAGVWDSTRKGHRLTMTVELFESASAARRAAVAAAAEVIARVQGLEAEVRFGAVFDGPPKGRLRIGPENA